MRLLLHICCAPCMIYCVQSLRGQGHQIEGFFYNPNIHPFTEYNLRRKAVEQKANSWGLKVDFQCYDMERFFRQIHFKETPPQRCHTCWHMRLRKAAQLAHRNKFDGFTTTLLISPYQDQQAIRGIAEKIAQEEGIDFYYRDFREGFRESQAVAKQEGFYRQKYCGCVFSERERFQK